MNVSSLRAVVALVGMTILAIVALNIFREGDNTALTVQIVGIALPTTAALLALMQSAKNNEVIEKVDQKVVTIDAAVAENTVITDKANQQIRELKVTVDGRLEQLLARTGQAEHAAGVVQGGQDERDRQSAQNQETSYGS